MHPSTRPLNNDNNNSSDKELVTLVVLVLLIASCHPCLSREIAARVHLSADVVRNAMLFAAATAVALFVGTPTTRSGDEAADAKCRT